MRGVGAAFLRCHLRILSWSTFSQIFVPDRLWFRTGGPHQLCCSSDAVENQASEFCEQGCLLCHKAPPLDAFPHCPFSPRFWLETIITGPSCAVIPSPQLCLWPRWTRPGHWEFILLSIAHSYVSPDGDSRGLVPGRPTGKKDPLSSLFGTPNTQETGRRVEI